MLLRNFLAILTAFSFGYFSIIPAHARDAFTLDVRANVASTNDQGSASFEKVEDLADALSDSGLQGIVGPNYQSETSDMMAALDVRGVEAFASYDPGSPELMFAAPSCGVSETFSGPTRDASEDLFTEYLKGNGSDSVQRLLQCLAAGSPIDPVAGNPNSLMNLMGAADFENATGSGTSDAVGPKGERPNIIGIGTRFGRYNAQDFDTNALTLPFSYTINLKEPGRAVMIDAPFTYVNSGGSEAYNASLGVGFRYPVLKREMSASRPIWTVTPAVRLGAVGSRDIGSATLIYSFSATSNYDLYFGDIKTSIGNMIGYYQTESVDVADFDVDYDLTNAMFRNGVISEGPLKFNIFGEPTSWQAAIVDTRFIGDDLFVEWYEEIAFSVGTRRRPDTPFWKVFRLGFTVTVGDNGYHGASFNTFYKF